MKNTFRTITVIALSTTLLAGCASTGSTSPDSDAKTITIGATEVPHAQNLNDVVRDLVEKEGYDLEITTFQDYVTPNTAVENGELDASCFKTVRYLDEQNGKRGLHLKAAAGIHLKPMGINTKDYRSLNDLTSVTDNPRHFRLTELAAETADGEDAHYCINYLVVKEGDEENEKTKVLMRALQSEEVKDYIEKTYSGSVIPAFTDSEGDPID